MIKYLVTWDIAQKIDRMRLHREIRRAATEPGIERIGGSVYVVFGIDAAIRAHVIAELAARCGAGNVGESGGPTVLQLDDENPNDYFANRDLARQVADELLLDHRRRNHKRQPRSITIIASQLGDTTNSKISSI